MPRSSFDTASGTATKPRRHIPMGYTAVCNLARDAGFRDDRPSNDKGQRHSELAVITAIVFAESGGRWWVVNPIGATGLTQIHPGGPQYIDPAANLRAAWAKYAANDRRFGRGPGSTCLWSTFCARAYLLFLPQAEAAVRRSHRDRPEITRVPGQVVHAAGTGIGAVAGFLGTLVKGTTWIRIGEVVFGGFLMLIALWLISRDLGLSGVEELTKKVPGMTGATKVALAMGAK